MRTRAWIVGLTCLSLAACASVANQGKGSALDTQQYAYSAAVRWGHFDDALALVDPKVLQADPVTDLELERYKQVQVSSYRPGAATSNLEAGTAQREVEIGVINRHTQAERTVRYSETWRYDADSKAWLVTSGLPDFWNGQ